MDIKIAFLCNVLIIVLLPGLAFFAVYKLIKRLRKIKGELSTIKSELKTIRGELKVLKDSKGCYKSAS